MDSTYRAGTARGLSPVSYRAGTVPGLLPMSYLSEQKSRRHWNKVAIACCSESGFSNIRHGVLDSGNAMYNTRTGQLMLCPNVARKQSHSLKPLRNSKPVPKSNPWIQEATESYVTFRRNMPGRDSRSESTSGNDIRPPGGGLEPFPSCSLSIRSCAQDANSPLRRSSLPKTTSSELGARIAF